MNKADGIEFGFRNLECGMKKREIGGREAERLGSGEGDKIEVEKLRSWEAEIKALSWQDRRWEAES